MFLLLVVLYHNLASGLCVYPMPMKSTEFAKNLYHTHAPSDCTHYTSYTYTYYEDEDVDEDKEEDDDDDDNNNNKNNNQNN